MWCIDSILEKIKEQLRTAWNLAYRTFDRLLIAIKLEDFELAETYIEQEQRELYSSDSKTRHQVKHDISHIHQAYDSVLFGPSYAQKDGCKFVQFDKLWLCPYLDFIQPCPDIAWTLQRAPILQDIHFDDYIEVPQLDILASVTWSCWPRPMKSARHLTKIMKPECTCVKRGAALTDSVNTAVLCI